MLLQCDCADHVVVHHILSYLPARDLKTIRLVSRLLAHAGRKNTLWSDLCRTKWSEKLCLQTIPVPSPHVAQQDSDDMNDDVKAQESEPPMSIEEYLLSMENFSDHTHDELKSETLHNLAQFFPAFTLVEGSWLRAYNLVERHMEISYLHATVRKDQYSISDTQWELYHPCIGLHLNDDVIVVLLERSLPSSRS